MKRAVAILHLHAVELGNCSDSSTALITAFQDDSDDQLLRAVLSIKVPLTFPYVFDLYPTS
jgi:hypothetical protein